MAPLKSLTFVGEAAVTQYSSYTGCGKKSNPCRILQVFGPRNGPPSATNVVVVVVVVVFVVVVLLILFLVIKFSK